MTERGSEGYGVVGSSLAEHTYKRHEGKLHGLSVKIRKHKKSAMTAITKRARG